MNFFNIQNSDYIESHSSNERDILADLRRETELKCLNPIMLSGKVQGIFLSIISKIINPKNVLEIGTYSGYSTLCIAEGLDANGIIHTIDKNEELLDLYDRQRRTVMNEFIQKQTIRNKKMIEETGDDKQSSEWNRMRNIHQNDTERREYMFRQTMAQSLLREAEIS